jgi:hypothetical protein
MVFSPLPLLLCSLTGLTCEIGPLQAEGCPGYPQTKLHRRESGGIPLGFLEVLISRYGFSRPVERSLRRMKLIWRGMNCCCKRLTCRVDFFRQVLNRWDSLTWVEEVYMRGLGSFKHDLLGSLEKRGTPIVIPPANN